MSETRAVNVYREPRYDVYCGRAGKGLDGYFGNPHTTGPRCRHCGKPHDRDGAVAAFRGYFSDRILGDREYARRVESELLGKTLGCFCAPLACHCDVYVEYLDKSLGDLVLMRDGFHRVRPAGARLGDMVRSGLS